MTAIDPTKDSSGNVLEAKIFPVVALMTWTVEMLFNVPAVQRYPAARPMNSTSPTPAKNFFVGGMLSLSSRATIPCIDGTKIDPLLVETVRGTWTGGGGGGDVVGVVAVAVYCGFSLLLTTDVGHAMG